MMKWLRVVSKYVLLLLASLLVLLCVVLISYNLYVSYGRRTCYETLSKKLGVQPTLVEIWESYDHQLSKIINPGMPRDQVLEEINKIAPADVFISGSLPENGYYDLLRLKVCPTAVSDVYFIFRYTSEDTLKNFSLDYRD